MGRPLQIALDCSDPAKLGEFWASALGYSLARAAEDGERVWLADPGGSGPSLLLHRVPEPKVGKNRLHLDIYVSPWGSPPEEARPVLLAESERLCAMGATQVRTFEEPNDYFIVLADPEGNEFCIA